MDTYQQFIALSRYSRFLPTVGRRELWPETVQRLEAFWEEKFPGVGSLVAPYIESLDVMPSMRSLMTAGPALDRDHVAGYNCSYLAIDNILAFDELMYICMCGTGVGYSVERQYIAKLPIVGELLPLSVAASISEFPGIDPKDLSVISSGKIRVADSKYGWASALRLLIANVYEGRDLAWDLSAVRAKGSPLLTFGGRASGPEPLHQLLLYVTQVFRGAKGRRLTSVEVHDICCKIGEVVIVGGVRRSAFLSLSNLTDERMRQAKSGDWWITSPHRALANNSICYTEKPDVGIFMREWHSLYTSKSGERGIFNRVAAKKIAAAIGRDTQQDFGCNPCSEIILRPNQFCNLSEVVVRASDTLEDLLVKVRIAAVIGTAQATLTNFVYLSNKWRTQTEDERLLGVSLTGIMDHPILSQASPKSAQWLACMRKEAHSVNNKWARKLGIKPATAITCVKPSGTVSQLVNCASGIHPRFSRYYIRTVRADSADPLAQKMMDDGFPYEADVMTPTNLVFAFPVRSPDYCITRHDRSAIEQLEQWLHYQTHWCDHKPSITVFIKEHEWPAVGAWVWEHFDHVSGVSFLPHTDHVYQQAPYQEIDAKAYHQACQAMPQHVDWGGLKKYEFQDTTTGSHTLACTGSHCEMP